MKFGETWGSVLRKTGRPFGGQNIEDKTTEEHQTILNI